MATCADCVHVEVCKFKDLPAPLSDSYIRESECIENRCGNFKDRSRFVNMTEIKQNVIRPLCNRCAALTDCQTCLACALEIREHCNHYKQIEQALKECDRE